MTVESDRRKRRHAEEPCGDGVAEFVKQRREEPVHVRENRSVAEEECQRKTDGDVDQGSWPTLELIRCFFDACGFACILPEWAICVRRRLWGRMQELTALLSLRRMTQGTEYGVRLGVDVTCAAAPGLALAVTGSCSASRRAGGAWVHGVLKGAERCR